MPNLKPKTIRLSDAALAGIRERARAIRRDGQKRISCPACGGRLALRTGMFGRFYGCENFPGCQQTCSAHQVTGEPVGAPGTPEDRRARRAAHVVFDRLWQEGSDVDGFRTRAAAYLWLADQLGVPSSECHIGQFDAARCARVLELVRRRRATNPARPPIAGAKSKRSTVKSALPAQCTWDDPLPNKKRRIVLEEE